MSLQTVLINRVAEIADNYDAFILPYYGVLSDGENVYPYAVETMGRLKRDDKKIIILANSPSKTHKMAKILEDQGVAPDFYDGLLTSGEVVYHELKEKASPFFKTLGTCYYHIGRSANKNDWVDLGYIPVNSLEEAEFIIVTSSENKHDAIERYLPFLRDAAGAGLPMLCVSPDKNLGLANSDDIGAGSIASRYEAMGGVVLLRGKPERDLFMYCLEGFPAIEQKKFLMVANSYTSDIQGAANAGIETLLVGMGTHARELGIALGKPLTLQTVNELSRHYGFFPNYVIAGLKY